MAMEMACIETDGTGRESAATARRTRDDLLERMEEHLRAFLSAEHELWARVNDRAVGAVDALSELVAAGGKRIRPAFCIAGYLAADGDPADPAVVAA
ncbi:hypothetical protein G3I28_46155, partial [Streptomyces sp. SID10116]|nr:hypothetical protein [Streptomyces sp. SID10116]